MYGQTTVTVQTRVLAAKTHLTTWHLAELHTVHKCHKPIKELHHFPSRIMGKPLQISKCQLHTNTFQLSPMQAAAGIRGEDLLCQVDHHHWGLRKRWTALRPQSQVKKENKETFKFTGTDLEIKQSTDYQLPCFSAIFSCVRWWWLLAACHPCSASTHVIIVTADDRSFVPHWCNRPFWSFTDRSTNYTLRTREEPIRSKAKHLDQYCPMGGSRVWLLIRHRTAVVLLQTLKNLRKNTRISPKTQVLEVLRAVGAS